MHLVVIGVNHRTSPIDVRERVSISEDRLPAILAAFKPQSRIAEALVLSTCNRTETYAYTRSRADDDLVIQIVADFCRVPREAFEAHLYSHAGHKTVEHLFRVASGIDSMVIGEAQILGQVKSAYTATSGEGSTGSVLNTLFQQAITVGKRARSETEIGRGAFSVGYAAVQLAKSIFDELKGRTMLIIGAGKMGELTLAHLSSAGATSVLVTNRTYERAVDLADRFNGRPLKFEEIPSALHTADIVITSTGSSAPIITREMVSSAMHDRRGCPVFFIDMAVPRDVAPDVGTLDNVFLYNIDDLQAAVTADIQEREGEVAKIENIVAEEVQEFMKWYRTLDAVPAITALREKFEGIRQAEIDKLRKRLSHLSEEDLEAINQVTRSIVNKISHHPTVQIKEYAASDDSVTKLDTVCELFGICRSEDDANDESEKRQEDK